MTTTRFRALVLGYGVMYSWYFSLAYNVGTLPEDIQSILRYSGYGAVLSPNSPLYFVPFVAALIGCVGLLILARWGRTLLMASIVAGVVIAPFTGVFVATAFEGLIGAIAGTLGPLLLGIAYSSPIAARLSRWNDAALEPGKQRITMGLTREPGERVVEVLRSGDGSLLAVLESVLTENDIPFSLAGESIQDLFGGGRLGGYNFAIGPARLFVRERDAAKVREILQELQVES